MKRFLSLFLCLLILFSVAPAWAEGADVKAGAMPSEARQFFSAAQFSGWTIGETACCLMDNTPGGSFFFAVAQKEGRSVLYGFEKKNGAYTFWLKTDNCLPQGEGFFQVRHQTGYLSLLNGETMDLGDTLSILFTRAGNEEQGDTELFFRVNQNGQFHLMLLCYDYLWNEARFTESSIAYYFEGDYLGTAYGTVETNLRYFSLSAFPRTLKEAREKLTNPPDIPSGELTAQKIKFTGGQKYPVYSGPGTEYERGAGGRASVSTNDWIQVFGSENGYILIQYAISSSQMRFGWIEQSALPKNANVSALRFAYADAESIADTFLTDDPLNSQTRVRALKNGQSVKWLSVMGSWVYVEAVSGSQPVRGFAPSSAIQKAAARQACSASFSNGAYTAQASALISGGRADITVTAEGPAAWNTTGADAVTGYQVYANNVPLQAECAAVRSLSSDVWRTVFTLSAVLPESASLLALCPMYAKSGAKADESLIFSLGGAAR